MYSPAFWTIVSINSILLPVFVFSYMSKNQRFKYIAARLVDTEEKLVSANRKLNTLTNKVSRLNDWYVDCPVGEAEAPCQDPKLNGLVNPGED